MSVAIILLDGLISGVEMGSEIPVQRSELIGLKSILESELSQLRADNERLKAELAEAKKDAARYRWLRDNCVRIANSDGKFQLPDLQNVVYQWRRREWVNGKPVLVLDGLDTAIDAAMKEK